MHVVVPFPAGGPTDTYARILADKLQAALGQPFVVENKAGASGIVGTAFVANAQADGYTLLFGSDSSQVISSLLQSKQLFDPLGRCHLAGNARAGRHTGPDCEKARG